MLLKMNGGHWHKALLIIGASRPDGIPYGFADFFFVLPPHFQHVRWPCVMKKTTDWAEILQNHTYGHVSGRGKKW